MPRHFARSQIALHWIGLILVILTFTSIELKEFIPKDAALRELSKLFHFNFGLLVFMTTFIRLVLFHRYPVPPIVPTPPAWEQKAANLMHYVLYITFILLPISGMLTLGFAGKTWSFLGIPMPNFITPDANIKSIVKNVHQTWANTAYFIIAFHAAAAIFHHYIQGDNTLMRMLPNKKN